MLPLAAGTRGSPRIPVADTFTLQFSAGPGTVATAVTGARVVGCWEVTSGYGVCGGVVRNNVCRWRGCIII